jgi:hypothetical protein
MSSRSVRAGVQPLAAQTGSLDPIEEQLEKWDAQVAKAKEFLATGQQLRQVSELCGAETTALHSAE